RHADSLARAIQQCQCQLVINTCGPFQARDYTCPVTVIKSGVHYIDLADAREYVCGFHKLDELAKRYGVLALTGASSVPALSSAVIDAMKNDFQQLHSIDVGINPGNQTPRGIATVRSILSYCGKPFLAWRDGKWKYITGWHNLTRRKYPQPMGKRWLSHCDIPDLNLFQQRYPGVKNIHFQAGLELSVLHLGTWLLAWFSHWGWVNDVAKYAAGLKRISERFYRFGSTIGGMHVELDGIDQQQQHLRKTWYLIAGNGDGPQVPCTAAVILAAKFQQRTLTQTGAYACMGFITLQEFEQEFQQYTISVQSDYTVTPTRAADTQSRPLPIHMPQQSPP
ncbi:MAG: saccharopine dehydrogenase, partial [Gammaproteobacteria bacterium]|nr:saccharopine dehydrogenase [Gammaproteobacteria bacterium]